MLSPAYSFAWLLWRQHGRGLLVVLGYLLIAGAIPVVGLMFFRDDLAHGGHSGVRDIKELVIKPLTFLPMLLLPFYVMVVFAYGLEVVDVSGSDSCFPARLFQLPVRTGSLTVWPIAYGATVTMLLWLIIAYFILEPWQEIDFGYRSVPLWWPGVLAAAALAWLQAVLWFPFGLPWLRVVFLATLLPAVLLLINFGVHSGTSESVLVCMFAGLTATAWSVAYVGVRRARGGVAISWEWLLWPVRKVAALLPQRRTAFASAAQAHAWYEWRASRFALPIMVGMGLSLFLWPLFFLNDPIDPAEMTVVLRGKYELMVSTLLVPVFCAGIGGGWLGSGRSRWVKDPSGMMPSIATLPMRTADIVGAVLRASVWSTLAAWAVVIVMVPLVVIMTGNLNEAFAYLQFEMRDLDLTQVVARSVAVATLLLVWTWKRKVYRLCLGLTGRKWLEITLGWGRLPAYVLFFQILMLIDELHISDATILAVLPWLIGLYMLCRLTATAWVLRLVVLRGLLEARTAKRWLGGWLLVAAGLFAVVVWAAPERMPKFYDTMPLFYCAAAVLFVMPMARLAAMPLALAWNRHR